MPTPLTTPLLSTTNAAANGVRLDEWLAARFAYFDAAGWAREIDAGRVHRNGAVAHAAERLGTGDTIAFFPAADENAAADIPILFADADLVVVAKPPHRVVQRASSIAGAAFLPA